jgi:hypothetical protein
MFSGGEGIRAKRPRKLMTAIKIGGLVMKRYLSFTIAIMMFLGVVTVAAEAQVFGAKQVRARIPFAFNVGKTTLPAGEYTVTYTVTVLNPSSDRQVLQVRSKDRRLSALIHSTETTPNNLANADKAKLVFNRYGDTYFFAQVQMAGDSTIWAAVKTSAERNQQRALAKNVRKATIAIIAE